MVVRQLPQREGGGSRDVRAGAGGFSDISDETGDLKLVLLGIADDADSLVRHRLGLRFGAEADDRDRRAAYAGRRDLQHPGVRLPAPRGRMRAERAARPDLLLRRLSVL